MIGITEINKIVSKKSKTNEAEVKKVTLAFLEAIKQKLAEGEDISFKNYFSLKRSTKIPKEISKFCDRHSKSINDYKKANKGKGISGFSKSSTWKGLMTETKGCSGCKSQKQKILKSTRLLPRVNCKMKGLQEIDRQAVLRKKNK